MKKNIEDRANTPCYTETHGGEVKENKARDYGGFQGLIEALAQSCGIDPSDKEGWVFRDNKRTTTEICEDNKETITDTRKKLENYDKQIVCNASTLSKVEDLKERVSEQKEFVITAMRDPVKTELLSKCDRLLERLNAKAERLRATPESKDITHPLPDGKMCEETILGWFAIRWQREHGEDVGKQLIRDIKHYIATGSKKTLCAMAHIIYESGYLTKGLRPHTFTQWCNIFFNACGVELKGEPYKPNKLSDEIKKLETSITYFRPHSR